MNTKTAAARYSAYRFLAALFSDPQTESFRQIQDPENQKQFLQAFDGLDLLPLVKEILSESQKPDIASEYSRLFAHTSGTDPSLYELEYLANQEVFSITQALADIQGFYKAFGLEVDGHERADHISVESEFMSFLAMKEYYALLNSNEENAQVCRKAQKDFWQDHYRCWMGKFQKALETQNLSHFYKMASLLIREFFFMEQELLHINNDEDS